MAEDDHVYQRWDCRLEILGETSMMGWVPWYIDRWCVDFEECFDRVNSFRTVVSGLSGSLTYSRICFVLPSFACLIARPRRQFLPVFTTGVQRQR
ncbi:hypothetical protein SCLCIDRAFT_1224698 [Scleroderma citrinum Foug A]|uniref:Uncharacterized protein n=1 Tax=Scleroderma citrinum Foug A TaxID=1036808 RepID=A0A0C2YND4_9AGAM|nr:hypothetical protein SCLCIDRAFT_1224698 [Scleroderma citrinum Foug A]